MQRKIAVFSKFSGTGEKILIGAANHFQKLDDWTMVPMSNELTLDELDFHESDYSGAIVIDANEKNLEELSKLSIPVVHAFKDELNSDEPNITVDHNEIGKMAAQHLVGRGFKNIAFVGGIDTDVARNRYQAFKHHLNQQNVNLHLFSETFPSGDERKKNSKNWLSFRTRLATWIEALPKPIGIFALDDWKAFATQMSCRKLGVNIPKDIAILGVNDDDLACQIAMPSLSSIRLPLEKVGFKAVSSIIELIETGKTSSQVLKPVGLVTRESTNTFAVKDKVVEEALKFMQQQNMKPIRVEEVLKHVGVSRSLLERRFRGEIGRTPLVEMRRQRVERARGLLADTELAINKISEMCGFASNIRFTTVFREQVGITPTEFRVQMQSNQ